MAIRLEDLVRELVEMHGDNLHSIVLYGSAVGTENPIEDASGAAAAHAASESDKPIRRLLIVLNEIAPSDLKRVRGVLSKWHSAGNPIPSYFTLEEIDDASDVFPIEFLDMSERRKVLAGRDPFKGLEISTCNLRHQVEYELRTKLIRLRSLYMPASGKSDRLARLMSDSLESFSVVFRHVVGLLGGEVPDDRHLASARICSLLDLDHSIFAQVERFGYEDAPILEGETEHIFAAYLGLIARIIASVDSLPEDRA